MYKNIYKASVSPGSVQQIMPYSLNGRVLDRCQV
jgi:hypothetical protein